MRQLLSVFAALVVVHPFAAGAQDCTTVAPGEEVCFTGVFPTDPILVEFGQPVVLPDSTYVNNTDRDMTFTIDWAGVDVSGSGGIPGVTLAPHTQQTVTGLSFPIPDTIPVGTHQIAIGWGAQGGNYAANRQRPFELVVLEPAQLREIIQIPLRWCVMEGSPQAGTAKPGETVAGTNLLSLLQQMNNEIWLPQASILFRPASAPQGIPVLKDKYPSDGTILGNLAMSNNDEWHDAGARCDTEWLDRYGDQRGITVVNGRQMIAETFQPIGGIAMAVPMDLRVGGLRGDDLCGHPRHLRVTDVTWLSITAVYDQALFGQARFNYTGDQFKPTRALAHELGHTIALGHGNGLDDNHDGLEPPNLGTRRFDEYCDRLGLGEDVPGTCEDSASLMQGSVECTNLHPLQREMAREAAKLVPGAVVADGVDPAGQLVASSGTCPPDCTIPRSLVLRKAEMAVTPGLGVTSFSHGVLQLLPLSAPSRYLVFADLDVSAQTGCSSSQPGLPVFDGAELKAEVAVDATGGVVTSTPSVWRCESGAWVKQSDPGIRATAYVQTVGAHDDEEAAPAGGVVTVEMPDDVRGPAGAEVRLQAISSGGGFQDLLPADGQGGLVSLTPPALPSCSVSPPIARPGRSIDVTVTGLPVNQPADIFVGDEAVGAAIADPDGLAVTAVAVPATFAPGVKSIEARARSGAVSAVCAVAVQGDAITPATTATLAPEPNSREWNNGVVTVSLSAVDAPGGPGVRDASYSAAGAESIAPTTVAGAQAAFQIAQEGHTVVTYFATSQSGVSEAPRALSVHIDRTAPTISFTANQGVYGVLDNIAIACAASDALSGILWDTCQNATRPAYEFTPGTNTYTATASDFADNLASGSTSFELTVTYGDLCALTRRFLASSSFPARQAKLLGNSLCAQLDAAKAAGARGALGAKRQAIDAYVKQVMASANVAFTPAQVEILVKLSRAL